MFLFNLIITHFCCCTEKSLNLDIYIKLQLFWIIFWKKSSICFIEINWLKWRYIFSLKYIYYNKITKFVKHNIEEKTNIFSMVSKSKNHDHFRWWPIMQTGSYSDLKGGVGNPQNTPLYVIGEKLLPLSHSHPLKIPTYACSVALVHIS